MKPGCIPKYLSSSAVEKNSNFVKVMVMNGRFRGALLKDTGSMW